MTQAPSWANIAKQNTVGKTLGEESHLTYKKAGRPKSTIQRKKILLNISDLQNQRLTKLEGQLKADGIGITRGRSETVELALALLETMLHSSGQRFYAVEVLKDALRKEERELI